MSFPRPTETYYSVSVRSPGVCCLFLGVIVKARVFFVLCSTSFHSRDNRTPDPPLREERSEKRDAPADSANTRVVVRRRQTETPVCVVCLREAQGAQPRRLVLCPLRPLRP